MKKLFFASLMLLMALSASADVSKMLGDWTTVDDKTGEKRSVVHIYKGENGMYYGKIVSILKGNKKAVCTECEGKEHGKPIEGLVILRDMHEEDGCLVGGRLLDPESGNTYYGKISMKDGKLVLRGSLDKRGLFGRNQTWVR